MKLSIFTLTLLSVSSVFANDIEGASNSVPSEMDIKYRDSLNKCTESINNYIKLCGPDEFTNNEASCQKVLNDIECKNFFDHSTSQLDGCNQLPSEYIAYFDNQRDFSKSLVKLACEKDENGKTCPITDVIVALEKPNENDPSAIVLNLINEENQMITDTCTSKTCTENSIAFIDGYLRYQNGVSSSALNNMLGSETMNIVVVELKNVSDKLKTNECLEAHTPSDGVMTNTTRLGTTILVTLGLLLYLF